jgi:hypothetical protein
MIWVVVLNKPPPPLRRRPARVLSIAMQQSEQAW